MKRLLDCYASDFLEMTKVDKLRAIQLSEGRTMVAETVVTAPPMYPGVTNQEIVARFGADLVLLNMLDVFGETLLDQKPVDSQTYIQAIKRLTGRMIGLNLEPVDEDRLIDHHLEAIPVGRKAVVKTLEKVKSLNLDFICLTGNPKTGVTHDEMIQSVRYVREIVGEKLVIIAGKMHHAGVTDDPLTEDVITRLIGAGTDIVLLPSPGTVPGFSLEEATRFVRYIHNENKLAMSTIGTSQEGSSQHVIETLALQNKRIGFDLHHIGDAGYTGLAIPENITAYSVAIRGKRHTMVRMTQAVNR